MRWTNYVLHRNNEFDDFWEEILSDGSPDVLFVIGLGFDPRACEAAVRILSTGGKGRRDAIVLDYDDGQRLTSDETDYRNANTSTIADLFSAPHRSEKMSIPLRELGGQSRASEQAAKLARKLSEKARTYEHLIVDIGAIPRVIALTLIAGLLDQFDKLDASHNSSPNFHVTVPENHKLDDAVKQRNLDEEAMTLHGFSGHLTAQSASHIPNIWLPILGENRGQRLSKIHTMVQPREVCPILPFPASDPRRADNLIKEYHELLFDEFETDPQNILYVSEDNPFEAYRRIYDAIKRYERSLRPLGGCKAFVTPLSSKLLSVGALLACYELKSLNMKIGIPYLEARNYGFSLDEEKSPKSDLYNLWIHGDCYER